MRFRALLFCLLAALPLFAVTPNPYQVGRLIQFQQSGMRGAGDNCTVLIIAVRGLMVHATQCPNFVWNMFDPAEFTVRGEIEVRFEGDRLIVRRPNGKELRAKIFRRIQLTPEERRRLAEIGYSAGNDRPLDRQQLPQQVPQPY